MSLLDKPNNTVRLSVLNPALRERVEKFDTGNDGELDINEAIQGLITLQKQSNNYKKMIWLLIQYRKNLHVILMVSHNIYFLEFD